MFLCFSQVNTARKDPLENLSYVTDRFVDLIEFCRNKDGRTHRYRIYELQPTIKGVSVGHSTEITNAVDSILNGTKWTSRNGIRNCSKTPVLNKTIPSVPTLLSRSEHPSSLTNSVPSILERSGQVTLSDHKSNKHCKLNARQNISDFYISDDDNDDTTDTNTDFIWSNLQDCLHLPNEPSSNVHTHKNTFSSSCASNYNTECDHPVVMPALVTILNTDQRKDTSQCFVQPDPTSQIPLSMKEDPFTPPIGNPPLRIPQPHLKRPRVPRIILPKPHTPSAGDTMPHIQSITDPDSYIPLNGFREHLIPPIDYTDQQIPGSVNSDKRISLTGNLATCKFPTSNRNPYIPPTVDPEPHITPSGNPETRVPLSGDGYTKPRVPRPASSSDSIRTKKSTKRSFEIVISPAYYKPLKLRLFPSTSTTQAGSTPIPTPSTSTMMSLREYQIMEAEPENNTHNISPDARSYVNSDDDLDDACSSEFDNAADDIGHVNVNVDSPISDIETKLEVNDDHDNTECTTDLNGTNTMLDESPQMVEEPASHTYINEIFSYGEHFRMADTSQHPNLGEMNLSNPMEFRILIANVKEFFKYFFSCPQHMFDLVLNSRAHRIMFILYARMYDVSSHKNSIIPLINALENPAEGKCYACFNSGTSEDPLWLKQCCEIKLCRICYINSLLFRKVINRLHSRDTYRCILCGEKLFRTKRAVEIANNLMKPFILPTPLFMSEAK